LDFSGDSQRKRNVNCKSIAKAEYRKFIVEETMVGKILNEIAGAGAAAEGIDAICGAVEKVVKKVAKVSSEKKEKTIALELVGTLEMVEMERYDLTGKVVFDEKGLAANQDPDASYSCIRFRIRNTGEQKITRLELKRAAIVPGDDQFYGEVRDIIFGTKKEGMQQELNLMPGEEQDIYFVAWEKTLSLEEDDDDDDFLSYEALYFVISLNVLTEGNKDMEEIGIDAVYRNGKLLKCGEVQF